MPVALKKIMWHAMWLSNSQIGISRASCRSLNFCRRFSSELSRAGKPKIAVIGSGPAAFYFATPVLRELPKATIDMFEKLPVPYGLVRYGVAPDHPEVKNCIHQFHETVERAAGRLNFRGNVEVGRDVSVEELRSAYDALVFCCGAEGEKKLGIIGQESVGNFFSARSFVGWYNGLPEFAALKPNLDTDTCVILGQGNVALDVARMLLAPIDFLAKTDISSAAMDILKRGRIRKVILVGRRGPLQVAFTIKELRELVNFPGCTAQLDPADFEGLEGVVSELPRPRKRITELLLKVVNSRTSPEQVANQNKSWSLKFLRSPISVEGDSEKVSGLEFVVNQLQMPDQKSPETARAAASDSRDHIECGLVISSVGYETPPIPGVPYDAEQRVIETTDGYHVSKLPGVYANGWCARGPVGVIATTQVEAKTCAMVLKKDFDEGKLEMRSEKAALESIDDILTLRKKGVKFVDWSGWKGIDKLETRNGESVGKPREKLLTIKEMLETAHSVVS